MKTVTIKENHLFEKCYRRGRRYSGRYLTVYTLPDYRAEKFRRLQPDRKRINRWGLTVTKRVGGAVVRSRVRRILREAVCAYMKNAGMPKLRTGFLVVLAAKEPAARVKTGDILADLTVAFQKVGLTAGQPKGATESAPKVTPKDTAGAVPQPGQAASAEPEAAVPTGPSQPTEQAVPTGSTQPTQRAIPTGSTQPTEQAVPTEAAAAPAQKKES